MYKSIMFCLCSLIALTVNAQNINVRGVVTDIRNGKVIPNATVTLLHQALKDTTVTTGIYAITKGNVAVVPVLQTSKGNISLNRGILKLTLATPAEVKVEIFNVKGDLLKKEVLQSAVAGVHQFNIAENNRATNLLVLKVSIGNQMMTFRCLPEHNNNFAVNASFDNSMSLTGSSGLRKTTADISDTLHFTANGYLTKMIPISSYDTTVNITLDSLLPGPSIGCGKTLDKLKSGTYTLSSAGLSRQYIINIPANYDKNHPYRLIFGMHCYGSSMDGVSGDKFYQLKRFADSTNTPCIFVAPNGTGNPALWNQEAKDHTFFNDMLKMFKDSLCVDTNRVFSAGFSYGAMFTYSLSTSHQKQLRAVACYAPANWNIWLPTNTHEPIGFMSTTGLADPNCQLVHDSAAKEGGTYCSLGHAADNGCIIPITLPMATSGSLKHFLYDYIGGIRPVKFYTFDGAHQCGPMDGVSGDNSAKSWIPGETWKFFMQF